jgi:hypothetical protein
MTDRFFEFLVDDVRPQGSRVLTVGRLAAGPLVVGDVFGEVFRHVAQPSDGTAPLEIDEASRRPAAFTVRYIESYSASFLVLDPGMTALLILECSSPTVLDRYEVLSGRSALPAPSERILRRLAVPTPFT